jgi:hypothetical protein
MYDSASLIARGLYRKVLYDKKGNVKTFKTREEYGTEFRKGELYREGAGGARLQFKQPKAAAKSDEISPFVRGLLDSLGGAGKDITANVSGGQTVAEALVSSLAAGSGATKAVDFITKKIAESPGINIGDKLGIEDQGQGDIGNLIMSLGETIVERPVKGIVKGFEDLGAGIQKEGEDLAQSYREEIGDPIDKFFADPFGAGGGDTGGGGATGTTGTTGTTGADTTIGEPTDIIPDDPTLYDPITGEQLSQQALYRRNRRTGAKGVGGTRKTGGRGINAAALSLSKNVLLGA